MRFESREFLESEETLKRCKKIKASVLVTVALLSGLPITRGFSEETGTRDFPVSWGTDTDVAYRYLWRGISYNRGFLIQPSGWVAAGNFSASTWINYTLYDADKAVKQHEVDISAQYELAFEDMFFTPSVNVYCYPNAMHYPTTGELAVSAGTNFLAWEISTNQYVDFLEYLGAYYGEAGLAYTMAIKDDNEFSIGINLGWASRKFNEAYNNQSPEKYPERIGNQLGLFIDAYGIDFSPTPC